MTINLLPYRKTNARNFFLTISLFMISTMIITLYLSFCMKNWLNIKITAEKKYYVKIEKQHPEKTIHQLNYLRNAFSQLTYKKAQRQSIAAFNQLIFNFIKNVSASIPTHIVLSLIQLNWPNIKITGSAEDLDAITQFKNNLNQKIRQPLKLNQILFQKKFIHFTLENNQ